MICSIASGTEPRSPRRSAKRAPGVGDLIAVRRFPSAAGDERRRARARDWWGADAGAQLINLSLGTSNSANAERLASAVAYATLRGALVVSARESNDVEWFPGSLPGVVGVVADATLERDVIDVRTSRRRDDGLRGVAVSAADSGRAARAQSVGRVVRRRERHGISRARRRSRGWGSARGAVPVEPARSHPEAERERLP